MSESQAIIFIVNFATFFLKTNSFRKEYIKLSVFILTHFFLLHGLYGYLTFRFEITEIIIPRH